MTTWHLSEDTLGRYAAGDVAPARAMSAETHLLACAACRTALAPAVDPPRLDRIWAEVVREVDAPRARVVERLLLGLGVRDSTARLVAATQSMTLSWWTGVSAALVLAALAAHAGDRGVAVFLALAPLLPVAGIALAYGSHSDPVHELAAAAPYSSFRLLLLRSAAVLSLTVALAAAAAALLPGASWLAAAWLLPALALTTATLALATWFDIAWTAFGLGVLWLGLALSGPALGADPLLAARAGAQLVSLAVAVGGALLLTARRSTFSTLGGTA